MWCELLSRILVSLYLNPYNNKKKQMTEVNSMKIAIVDDNNDDAVKLAQIAGEWNKKNDWPLDLHTYTSGEAFLENSIRKTLM